MACGVLQKCSGRYAGLVRVYISIPVVPAAALAIAAAIKIGPVGILLPALTAAAGFWAVCLLPGQYADSVGYTRHRDWLKVERGLLWHQQILIPRRQIQYVRLRQDPLERLFGLNTLVFMTPGGRVCLRGLEKDEAEHLRRLMERGMTL